VVIGQWESPSAQTECTIWRLTRWRCEHRNRDVICMRSSSDRCITLESMDDYDLHWRDLKSRRNQLLFAFVGYVPITLAFALLTHKVFHSDNPSIVFAIAWMLFFALAGVRYNTFRCPRCGEWFFSTWWYHNSFARRCVHCKLPLYSTKEQAGQYKRQDAP
jgi:hypothetical protein